MTQPNPISQYAPNNSGDRTDFTDKKDLLEVPLIITNARTAKGKSGVFWIVEAARQDTGEHVVFTGSTVIDQTMAAVKEASGFPVAAMLVKVQPEEGNWYWNLIDPPASGVESAASNGDLTNGSAPDRIAQVEAMLKKYSELTKDDVPPLAKKYGAEKVRDLSDEAFTTVLAELEDLALSRMPEPPF